jgi:hypothetical protein
MSSTGRRQGKEEAQNAIFGEAKNPPGTQCSKEERFQEGRIEQGSEVVNSPSPTLVFLLGVNFGAHHFSCLENIR